MPDKRCERTGRQMPGAAAGAAISFHLVSTCTALRNGRRAKPLK